jgi:hypothetical protein
MTTPATTPITTMTATSAITIIFVMADFENITFISHLTSSLKDFWFVKKPQKLGMEALSIKNLP